MTDASGTPPAFLPRTRARLHAAPESGRPLRLTAVGSSTTEGHGASGPAAAYPSVLRRELLAAFPGGIVLANLGIGGESAIEMDGRLDAVIATGPDLIVWQTGSNDVTRPVPLDRFEALTAAGIARLRATGADLVLMDQQYSRSLESCPALPDYLAALNRVAAEAGVPVFPRHAVMRGWCESGRFSLDGMSPDGTHMEDAGYRALGEAVAAWLRSMLAT